MGGGGWGGLWGWWGVGGVLGGVGAAGISLVEVQFYMLTALAVKCCMQKMTGTRTSGRQRWQAMLSNL